MAMDQAPDLGPNKDIPRIQNTPTKPRQKKTPAQLAKEREDERDAKRPLSEKLINAAMAIPAGEGMFGKALKAGMGGAAAGATLGEALASLHQKKIQKGQPTKPKTVSGMAMTDTDLGDELYMAGKGRNPGPQQTRYTRKRRELEGPDYVQPTGV